MSHRTVGCYLVARQATDEPEWAASGHLVELAELVHAAGMEPLGSRVLRRHALDPRTYYGRGQIEEAAREAKGQLATLLVCDDDLTGGQVNAIQKTTGLQVIDRTGLILTIFEQRARTQEAKVQVELARCEYELPRLKGAWTHLERQVGGVGVRGGPGETQIEVDRRITRQRIGQLKKELQHLERVRETQRQGRIPGLPRVALVGYTNAGKTSILRALTGEGEPQDQLFATLDTTTRRAWLGADPESGKPSFALVSDTVGFIRKLPHQLVAAFRSTLGEVRTAEALLVVADASSPELESHLQVVGATLREIGCGDHPRLLVLNQVDRLTRPRRLDLKRRHPGAAFTCALSGEGIADVRGWLQDLIPGPPKPRALEAWEQEDAEGAEGHGF